MADTRDPAVVVTHDDWDHNRIEVGRDVPVTVHMATSMMAYLAYSWDTQRSIRPHRGPR